MEMKCACSLASKGMGDPYPVTVPACSKDTLKNILEGPSEVVSLWGAERVLLGVARAVRWGTANARRHSTERVLDTELLRGAAHRRAGQRLCTHTINDHQTESASWLKLFLFIYYDFKNFKYEFAIRDWVNRGSRVNRGSEYFAWENSRQWFINLAGEWNLN